MSPSSTLIATTNHRKENIDRNLRIDKMVCPDTGLETMPFQTTLVSKIYFFYRFYYQKSIYIVSECAIKCGILKKKQKH